MSATRAVGSQQLVRPLARTTAERPYALSGLSGQTKTLAQTTDAGVASALPGLPTVPILGGVGRVERLGPTLQGTTAGTAGVPPALVVPSVEVIEATTTVRDRPVAVPAWAVAAKALMARPRAHVEAVGTTTERHAARAGLLGDTH